MLEFLIAVTLSATIHFENCLGRIGVYISPSGVISIVRHESPAEKAGLLKGDKVVQVDHKKTRTKDIEGEPGTVVDLTIERNHEQFEVQIERIDYRLIRKD